MENEGLSTNEARRPAKGMPGNGAGGAVYGLGFIGAAVYFIQHATTFWNGVFGLLQALVWPAILVYKLLEFLKL